MKYKLKPQISFLQVKKSDFESRYNVDCKSREQKAEKRGGQPYCLPIGWYRHALNVVDKHPHDKLWLGKNNVDGEWPVAFVHTNTDAIEGIEDKGVLFRSVDSNRKKPVQEGGPKQDKNGYYVPVSWKNGIHPQYIKKLNVENAADANERYRLVFQCRIKPNAYVTHKNSNGEDSLHLNDCHAMRPYGILIKRQKNL